MFDSAQNGALHAHKFSAGQERGRGWHELNAVVLGAELGSQLHAMFKKDLAEPDAITLELWERRPLNLRLQELFARAWEYWL